MIVIPYSGNHTGSVKQSFLQTGVLSSVPNTMLSYFTGATLNLPLPRTSTGIKIDRVAFIQIGNFAQSAFQNIFDKMDYGIVAAASKLFVYNNRFRNITTTALSAPNVPVDGFAVWATGGKVLLPMGLTVGGSGLQKNFFTNCGVGVLAQTFLPSVVVDNNTMQNCVWNGIHIQLCQGNNAIVNNIIQNIGTSNLVLGIACTDVVNSFTYIADNRIFQTYSGPLGSTGIQVYNANSIGMNLTVTNNIVTNKHSGILLRQIVGQTANPLVFNNRVQYPGNLFNPTTLSRRGIALEGCGGAIVDENTVASSVNIANVFNNTNANFLRGISVENSPGSIVTENKIIKMGDGIYGLWFIPFSRFYCNDIHQSFFGFDFQGPAAIFIDQPDITNALGQTVGTRNRWINNVPAGFKLNGAISPTIHWYYHTLSGNYSPFPTSLQPLSLFNNNNPEQAQDASFDICALFIAPPPPQTTQQRDAIFGRIVRNQNQYLQDSAEFKYSERKFAYGYFKKYPWVLNMNTWDDSLYQNFYSYHQTNNIGLFEQVQDFVAQNNILNAITLNASCTPSSIIEINRQTVNHIYLSTWAEGILEFTSQDSTTLFDIAYQNPLQGGDAVYSARTMLRLEIDDATQGNRIQFAENTVTENSSLIGFSKIYPNPNNGTMQLDYMIDEKSESIFIVYDITGRKILTYKLDSKNNSLAISSGLLQNGVYFYEIIVNNKVIAKSKIVIIK